MTRRLCILALTFAVLPLMYAPVDAQEDTSRQVELRLVALSRGYLRPMKATAVRIAGVEGVESVQMLGFAGDMARYQVTTKLNDKALAAALEMKLVGSGDGIATMAAELSPRAKHAEARGILTEIATAIMNQPQPTWMRESEPLFDTKHNLKQRLERLGLSMDLMRGTTYTPEQFHIEEDWQGSGGTYKIWAGDKWEGIYVPSDDWYLDPREEDDTKTGPIDPSSNFVGIRVYRSPYSLSMSWVDVEGLRLAGFQGRRDATDGSGELFVKLGADWMETILKHVGALRVREPKRKMDRLPTGQGWEILAAFNYDDSLQRDVRHFAIENFDLSWSDRDGNLIATLRAHHPAHPFFLEAELDTNAVLKSYEDRAKAEDKKFKDLKIAELGDALTWIVAAEDSIEVFERRRAEGAAVIERICEAVRKLPKDADLDLYCGALSLDGLQERLGITIEKGEYEAGDYAIRRQLLGDLEISVGNVRSGVKQWVLINARSGQIIRRSE